MLGRAPTPSRCFGVRGSQRRVLGLILNYCCEGCHIAVRYPDRTWVGAPA